MRPYYQDEYATIYHGDCREILPHLDPVETCITDPPYGLAFMGQKWDHAVPDESYWSAVREVVLPGGYLLAFGGTRLWHWLAVGVEQGGWKILDTLMWLYGSGFPKSLDISKAIDRQRHDREDILTVTAWIARARDDAGITNADIDAAFGFNGMAGHWTTQGAQAAVPTLEKVPRLLDVLCVQGEEVPVSVRRALLDANGFPGEPGDAWFEREVVGEQTKARSTSGKSALPTMGGRTVYETWDLTAPATEAAKTWDGWGTALKPAWEPVILALNPTDGTYAENAQRHGVAGLNIDGARIGIGEGDGWDVPQPALNSHTGMVYGFKTGEGRKGEERSTPHTSGRWPANLVLDEDAARMVDTSGASRFFYTAKASRSDRGRDNNHPTVKPSDLMKWLCTLTATPTGGTVLDPFMGSGTTLYAAKETHRRCIGIELEERWCEVAANRLSQGVLPLEAAE